MVAYTIGTFVMAFLTFIGIRQEQPWADMSSEASALYFLWENWKELGKNIFSFAGLFLTTYAGSRGLEKVAGSIGGRAGSVLGGAAGLVTGSRPEPVIVREEMDDAPETIQKLDGIVVPGREATVQPLLHSPEWAWGVRSKRRLARAHEDLNRLFDWTLSRSPYDITIGETTRTVEKQRENIKNKVSKTMDSRHLERPAMAVDFYIIDPVTKKADVKDPDLERYVEVLNLMRQGSKELGIPITSGGLDWGWDYYHIELDRDTYPRLRSVLDEEKPDVILS